ncbi:hypothetical protein [Streptomyces marincola]|uniref:hypothetical protein n=1 Tax=Streptomyces marincola TaxID=2878388 RepID=UPI001CF3D95F|nr:hypothetical protein [Streptomyces marincola]UCM90635.1 hypothetical protein LC193_23330 [Streptomyces marincola]
MSPAAVYRLLPRPTGARHLSLGPSLDRLMTWQYYGWREAGPLPAVFEGEWRGDPGARPSAFPSGDPGAPVLGPRVADAVGEDLLAAGSLRPVVINGTDAEGYVLYVVDRVADCLDVSASLLSREQPRVIHRAAFRPEALPAGLPAFRVPQSPCVVYWNGPMAERLATLLGADVELSPVWPRAAQDRARRQGPRRP